MQLNVVKINRLFSYWLNASLLLIIFIIIVGGLTRLTNSGLSITEWELFSGILPPLNKNDWIEYFNLYKAIPQFKFLYPNMTLPEFKIIFYWEYIHRILGRLIGLFFIIPFIYLLYKSLIKKKYLINFLLIFFLILLQGLIGWYMVQSGLINNTTVSHYRLSLHLTTAFIILTSLVWNYLNINSSRDKYFFKNLIELSLIRILLFLLFIQIIIGALVSGLDAGKIYQTWPLMGETFFPDDIILKKTKDLFDFNNHSWVQFLHRINAYLILIIALFIGYNIYQSKNLYILRYYLLLLSGIIIQSIIGILALISDLNVVIASLHQISSIFLIIASINFYYKSVN